MEFIGPLFSMEWVIAPNMPAIRNGLNRASDKSKKTGAMMPGTGDPWR